MSRYLVTLSLASMAVVGALQVVFNFRNRTREVADELAVVARSAGSSIDGYISGKSDLLAEAAWFGKVAEGGDGGCRLTLQGILGYEPSFRWIALADGNGTVLAEATRRSSFAEKVRLERGIAEAVVKAEDGRPYMSAVHFDPASDEPLMDLAVPVPVRVSGDRRVIAAELNLKFMWELLDALKVGSSGRVYVVDRAGGLVAHADPSLVLARRNVAGIPSVAAIARGDDAAAGDLLSYADLDGRRVVGAFIPLEAPDWGVIVELPWLEAYARTIQEGVVGVLLYLALAVAVAIVGARISWMLSSPVTSLERAASAIAGGAEVLRVEAPGTKETAALADAFNAMTSRLKENERRFELLNQNSSDIVAVIDQDGIQTYVSPNVTRVLGWTPEELTGKCAFGLVHPEDLEATMVSLKEALGQPGTPHRAEFRIMHREGRWVAYETIGVNRMDVRGVEGIVLNSRDVSERRMAEAERSKLQDQLQQAMKMEAVGRLAGGIAHDFNNLLTCIMGNVELGTMDAEKPESVKRYFTEVKRSAESAASLTRQLLAFSRKQLIEPRALDLNLLVRGLETMLGRLLGDDVRVRLSLSDGLPAVKVDPGQFEQVLVNLAVNSRDAMPKGGTLVIATALSELDESSPALRPGVPPGKRVLLSVSDDGEGMDDECKRHLFEPFYTTKGVGKGTGLGLATVYGAVIQAGGSIEVHSEKGYGARFNIYLPLAEGPAAGPSEPRRGSPLPLGSETVLLVEDQEGVLRMVSRMLGHLGYGVVAASCGEEALRLLEARRGEIDLILSDVVMPGMNGKELADKARETIPGVKVLLCSGYAESVALKGDGEEGYPFLGKPYTLQALAEKLRETLDA